MTPLDKRRLPLPSKAAGAQIAESSQREASGRLSFYLVVLDLNRAWLTRCVWLGEEREESGRDGEMRGLFGERWVVEVVRVPVGTF